MFYLEVSGAATRFACSRRMIRQVPGGTILVFTQNNVSPSGDIILVFTQNLS
ncbi:hypothetical protein [Paenibacillus sp. OV219]|uniref:hypothetical protein n=1 Tax=Paenibacillus sp. OV219 TaxID=1884377 RepID=UPI0015A727D0|nr:hypothetical protein [Paenibacillus sp. OV219]